MDKLLSILNYKHTPEQGVQPTDSGGTVVKYLLILVQLGALTWLVNRYAIEENLGFPEFLPLVLSGFFIHSILPFKWRLPFFTLLGIAGTFWVLNWLPAIIVLAMVALFFTILQLPLSVTIRSVLLALAALALAFIWIDHPTKIPDAYKVVPIVGSIFMFRASVYLYDIRFEKSPAPFFQQLAYFLMLPNLIFTLFPVVDYKIFNRSYYSKPALEIYQQGVRWMIRGFFHLMLYRIIYYYVQPNIANVDSLLSFVFYALTSYMLILRLSGLFHSAIGILCLFGFNLPVVFHNYFLASGFSDLWRRINVYWRDYIMKVFYYPIYFKLRNIGKTSGMVLSILLAFGITWMLHSFQWFWLQGQFPFRAVDAIFWGVFGVAVAGSSVYQQLVPKKNRFSERQSYIVQTIIRTTQIAALLAFMSLLWTFWNSPSLEQWVTFVSSLDRPGISEWGILSFRVFLFIIMGTLGFYLFDKTRLKDFLEPDEGKSLSIFWGMITLGFFALLTIPQVANSFQGLTPKPVEHIYNARLTEADDMLMVKGYYEDILVTNQLTSPLANIQERPADWISFPKIEAVGRIDDWRRITLLPNKTTEFKGAQFSTNQWGMRDKFYPKQKEENHFRMGIFGGSYVMGSGVTDPEVFDEVCEDRLNEELPFGYEYDLLNFSIATYHLPHQLKKFESEGLEFELDAAVFVSHGVDFQKATQTVLDAFRQNLSFEYDFIMDAMTREGFQVGNTQYMDGETRNRMDSIIVSGCYNRINQLCKDNNIQPVLLYWPRTQDEPGATDMSRIFDLARTNNFIIIDMNGLYEGYKLEDIILASFDKHPNKLAHQIVANKLFEILTSNPEITNMIRERRDEQGY